ncbi:MAG: hypothetical protein U1F43_19630 [Myxococcota bacterium]
MSWRPRSRAATSTTCRFISTTLSASPTASPLDQAKVKASASIGTYFKAHASASVKGLGFERAKSGKVAFGMDDLTLSGLGLHGGKIPKGSLVESFAGTDFKAEKIGALKARAELDPTTGAVTVKASLGVARLADIAWAGDTTALRAHGAEVSGASLEASLKVDAAFLESLGKEGKVSAAAIARSLKIERAHIERIAGTDIRYSDPDLPPIYLAKGRFEGIDVSGLDLASGKGAFDLTSAHLETATGENGTASARWPEFLQTLLEKAGTDLLKASAEVDIDGVHVQRMGDGKTTFALQQLVAGARAEADARNAVGARVKATKWSGERDDKSGEVTAHGGIVASGGAKWSAPYTPNSEASAGLTANVDITQNKTGAQVGIHDGHLQATIPALPAGAQTLTFEGIEGGLKVDDHGYTVDARLAELGVKKLVVASTSGTLVLGEATLDDIALELSAHLVAGKDNKAVIDRVDIPLVSMTSAHIDDGRFIAPDKTEIEFGGGSIEGLEIDDTSIAFGDDATVLKSGTVHVDRLAGRVGEKLAKAGNLSAKGIGFVSASDGSSYVGIEQIQAARAELKQRGDPEGDGYSLEEVVAVGVAASTGADGHGAASAASVEAKASGAGRGKQYVSGDQAGDPAASAIDWDLDALDPRRHHRRLPLDVAGAAEGPPRHRR